MVKDLSPFISLRTLQITMKVINGIVLPTCLVELHIILEQQFTHYIDPIVCPSSLKKLTFKFDDDDCIEDDSFKGIQLNEELECLIIILNARIPSLTHVKNLKEFRIQQIWRKSLPDLHHLPDLSVVQLPNYDDAYFEDMADFIISLKPLSQVKHVILSPDIEDFPKLAHLLFQTWTSLEFVSSGNVSVSKSTALLIN